jgi:hypothetical protein
MLRVSAVVLFALAACGGSTLAPSDAGSSDDASSESDSAFDASIGACFGPQVMCTVCNEGVVSECVDGNWTCPVHSCPADASVDASSPFDAFLLDAAVACGPMLVCDGDTEICRLVQGGLPPPPDASVVGSYSCVPIPTECEPLPTCACIQSDQGCECSGQFGDFTVVCDVP